MLNKVAVVGFGGVGGFLTALLIKANVDVITLVRSQSIKKYREENILLSSSLGESNFTARLQTKLNTKVDLIILAIKVNGLADLESMLPKVYTEDALIIPLLNGFSHYSFLQHHFMDTQLVTSTIGHLVAFRQDEHTIAHESLSASISLASENIYNKEKLNAVVRLFRKLGLDTALKFSKTDVIWEKLSRLSIVAALTAAAQLSLGVLKKNEYWREKMISLTHEISAIAAAEGYKVTADELLLQLDNMPDNVTTSLQRDIAKGLPGELNALIKDIIDLAESKGFPCHELKNMYHLLHSRLHEMSQQGELGFCQA